MQLVALLLCVAGVAFARMPYEFSDGYLEVLGSEPTESFDCEGKPYGYYADVANDCKVFHICLPIPDFNGEIFETYQYSFFCGNQTVFSQESLTCAHPEDAIPCSESESLYALSNADFGKIPDDNEVQSLRAVDVDEED